MLQPRRATRNDLAPVEAIVRAAYSPYVARMGREPGPMLDDYSALIDQGRVYVIERDAVVQGLLVLVPEPEAMLLDNVAVAPEWRGSGIGRALLAFAEREAVAAGYDRIRLYTHETMIENVALYSRLGYVETHRAEEKGLRRIHMSKPLGTAARP